MSITLFISMLFFHVLDDYCLQGILASMKQRSWWEQNAPDKKYRHDYIAALIAHAFSWAFMIMIPVCWAYVDDVNPWAYTLVIVANTLIHASVDHLKANTRKINLIQDQLLHVGQILITCIIFSI